jgi:hypothetical protein
MTQVNCRQRQCLNWDEGVCAAEDIVVDRTGVCLTQDEDSVRTMDTTVGDRPRADDRRTVPFVDDEDEDWEDDDLPTDDDEVEDDEDWDDDE